MKIKVCLLIASLITLQSCKTLLFNDAVGTYAYDIGFERGTIFQLKEDSTFKYRSQEGLIFWTASGKWRLKKDEIILNSFDQKDIKIRSFVNYKALIDTTVTRLIAYENETKDPINFSVTPYYNGNPKPKIQSSNNELTLSEDFDSLKLNALTFYPITIKKSKYNAYEIMFVFNAIENNSITFKNAIWKLKGNRLVDDAKINYSRKISFRKIENQ